MKISLKLIAQEITKGEVHIAATRKNKPDAMRLNHHMLYTKTDSPNLSVCYIIDAMQLKPDFDCPSGIALVVLGQCDPLLFRTVDADVMIWSVNRREMNFKEQYNTISSIFHHYQQTEQNIYHNLINSTSLQELIEIGEKMLHNTILVLDASFCLLFETRKENPLDWEITGYPQVYSLPAETIEQIRVNHDFRIRTLNNGLFFISNEVINCNALFMQIQRDHLTFFIVVLETEQAITQTHYQLLSYFSNFIYLSLRNKRFSNKKSMQFEYFLERMLVNEKVEESEISRQLQTQQWKISDQYICYVVDLNLWNQNDVDPYTISKMQESRFPGSFSFYHEDRIICLHNLTHANMSRELFLQLLAPFVRDNLFHIGLSFEFHDFKALAHYYHQAIAAIEFGKQKHPDEWIYRFEKYALDYFTLYGISKMEPRHLCHPDLILLAQYDKENNTDFLNTLKIYLTCGMNATEASAELFIHRNTLYQRISKIEQLIQSKLNQPATRLYMQISFSFMDFSSL